MVDDDHTSGAEQPRAPGRHDPDGTGTEDHHRVARLNAGHLGRLVPGRHDIGEKHRVVEIHRRWDLAGANIGIGDTDILRLAPIVAAGRVRIAKDAPERARLRIGFMAIAEETLPAEMALAAGDVERDDHVVADREVADLRPDLLDDTDEFMAESHAHPGIGNEAMVEMKVRAADAGAGHPHDGILDMFADRNRLPVDPNPVGPAIVHRQHVSDSPLNPDPWTVRGGSPRRRLSAKPDGIRLTRIGAELPPFARAIVDPMAPGEYSAPGIQRSAFSSDALSSR